MDYFKFNEVKQHLLASINHLAPTGKDQEAAVKMLRELEMAGENNETIIRCLLGCLYDGVAYGNWPSTLANIHQELI